MAGPNSAHNTYTWHALLLYLQTQVPLAPARIYAPPDSVELVPLAHQLLFVVVRRESVKKTCGAEQRDL